jgi:hypothetical protein
MAARLQAAAAIWSSAAGVAAAQVDFPISEVVLSCKGWKSAVEVLDPEALADWGQQVADQRRGALILPQEFGWRPVLERQRLAPGLAVQYGGSYLTSGMRGVVVRDRRPESPESPQSEVVEVQWESGELFFHSYREILVRRKSVHHVGEAALPIVPWCVWRPSLRFSL